MSKHKVIQALEQKQIKTNIADFAVGDTVSVKIRIIEEGGKERLQTFQGTVIAREDELVKLVDFGLALPVDPIAAKAEKVTLDGYVTGTPAYMSPEQCLAEHVDSRSDIYSLGCIMFRALTGLAPIAGATPQDTMTKQVRTPPTPFARAAGAKDIPPRLQQVILKCLEKKPDDRYQSVVALKEDLFKVLD